MWWRERRSAGCSCRPHCSISCSWARRVATSVAGCCRSSRSCACSRRCSRCSWPARSCAGDSATGASAGEDGAVPVGAHVRLGLTALLVVALLAQGLVYSIHSGLVLARADTRNLTREWMLAHIPAGAQDRRRAGRARGMGARSPGADGGNPYRWRCIRAVPADHLERRDRAELIQPEVGLEDYEPTLSPALIDFYEREGYCWVISGSTQSGRAYADPQSCRGRSPTTERWHGGARSSIAPPPTPRGRARSSSDSTGASTTTRSPTNARART